VGRPHLKRWASNWEPTRKLGRRYYQISSNNYDIETLSPRYEKKVKNILEKCGYCWSGWSYVIDRSKEEILKKQDSFNIYIHDIENPTESRFGKGTGMVNYRLFVEKNNYEYKELRRSPEAKCTPVIDTEKPHRLYAKIINEPFEISSRKWNTFIDFDTSRPLTGRYRWWFRNADFGYVIDPYI